MSYDEKKITNRFRLSKEISLGDLLLLLGIVAAILNVRWQVQDHEKRITVIEAAQMEQGKVLSAHETAIAVLKTEQRQSNQRDAGPSQNSQF
jgi:hypothetical protein